MEIDGKKYLIGLNKIITKDRIDDVCRRIIVAINQIPDSVSDNDDYLNYVKL
jgi:hypothetical protein